MADISTLGKYEIRHEIGAAARWASSTKATTR
jgi:hypothetical protein